MTRSSSPRSSCPTSSSSPPAAHCTSASIVRASSSTSSTSVPAGSPSGPSGRSVHGGLGETPTRRTPPLTLSSVPSGSVGMVAEQAVRASASSAAPAIVRLTIASQPRWCPGASRATGCRSAAGAAQVLLGAAVQPLVHPDAHEVVLVRLLALALADAPAHEAEHREVGVRERGPLLVDPDPAGDPAQGAAVVAVVGPHVGHVLVG